MQTAAPLLEVEGLEVEFRTRQGIARVLDGVTLSLKPGQTLGIVGESGCGKSMTALSIMRLVPTPPGRIGAGAVRLKGENLLQASEARMREVRGKDISMIFQEPMTSLNPVYSIGDQIAETVRLHERLSRRASLERAVNMLKAVHIPAAERRVREFPHQMSGGMRQRVMIAMALACRPSVLIADEPTTALDVTVQAQVFDLLKEMQEKTGTAIILISHDMGAIAEMADRVIVMYAGRVVEEAATDEILESPKHPYTRGLIACVPHMEEQPPPERGALTEIPGVVPSLAALGAGCSFAPRCSHADDLCRRQAPQPFTVGTDRRTACWLYDEPGAP
ncbi:MAG: ABC transporter ATP-binding protein [Alphaproteobacteria bacterium]|nr:ABC transporter ATP-binding protein [Alphaproteobacteria bacterium]